MLTENDVSLMTISFISDLDQELSRQSDAFRGRFHLPASASVRCVKYRTHSYPLIEAYLESDISPELTLSFHLDVQFDGQHWVVSQSIQRDGVTSEQLQGFGDLETANVEGLRQTVLRAAAEGFTEFERVAARQLAA